MTLPKPPPGFVDLDTAVRQLDKMCDVMGVCTDFLPATHSRGSDMTIKFTLHDPTWCGDGGMSFRFFHKLEKRLPAIQNTGDVVVIRNIKVKQFQGQCFGLSNSATSWVVITGTTALSSTCPQGSDIQFQHSGEASATKPAVGLAELEYAKAIAQAEDPGSFRAPPKSTALQIGNIQKENGGEVLPTAGKYRLVEQLELPKREDQLVFAELFGEVRRVFSNDFRVELSITDYTSNPWLYNYSAGNEGYDGDEFNYVGGQGKWPGPFGKMSLSVMLWEPHAAFVRTNVKLGDFVYLRNVKIALDPNKSRMEGKLHGDRFDSGRVNVSIYKPREADGDDRFKDLLRRRREYEQKSKTQGVAFVSNAINQKRKRPADELPADAEQDSGRPSKMTKNARKKAKAAEASLKNTAAAHGALEANQHVRCNNYEVPLKAVDDILDPQILRRTTPVGNDFALPFQNCCYKSKVRVVDYFPRNIADFCAPFQESGYAALSDHDSDLDSEPGLSSARETQWEWRFFLLVEDARFQAPTKSSGSARMELLVADTDAEFLLRMTACDLRQNPRELAKLQEKLFLLWGDLQERKDEAGVDGALDPTANPKARPFECCIMEYGIAQRTEDGRKIKDDKVREGVRGRGVEFDRMFRLFATTI